MPFKSKSQARMMYAKHPKMAKKWAKHTPNMKMLPEKKKSSVMDKFRGSHGK